MSQEPMRRKVIRSYEDIEAFQRSMALLKPAHQLVLLFPEYERYDLTAQIRRASKSVPANIAEGYGKRRSAKDFKSYLANALGSVNELIVHFRIAEELEYIDGEKADAIIGEYRIVGKQLTRLLDRWE